MILCKSHINLINKFYIGFIKDFYKQNQFTGFKQEQWVTTFEIAGAEVDFYLCFDKQILSGYEHKISADYFYEDRKKIVINLSIYDNFNDECFFHLNYLVKSYLLHEIEHHLQYMNCDGREKLLNQNFTSLKEYICSKSELEAYLKQLYYLHKVTKTSFLELLFLESKNISKMNFKNDEDKSDIKSLFIGNMIRYIRKRKDLNLKINF